MIPMRGLTCLLAVILSGQGLTGRELPPNWGWTEIWPVRPFDVESIPHLLRTTDAGVLLARENYALQSSDGRHWTEVPLSSALALEVPEQRVFLFEDELSSPGSMEEAGIARDAYPVTDLARRRAEGGIVCHFHAGRWWGVSSGPSYGVLRSDPDGVRFFWVAFDHSAAPEPYNSPDPNHLSPAPLRLASDGEQLVVVKLEWSPIPTFGSAVIYSPSEEGTLIFERSFSTGFEESFENARLITFLLDGELGFLTDNYSFLEAETASVREGNRTRYDRADEASLLNPETVLVVAQPEEQRQIAILDLTTTPAELPVFVSPAGERDIVDLAATGGVALILDDAGTLYRSTDGIEWVPLATDFGEGDLMVERGLFLFAGNGFRSVSADGVDWQRTEMTPPSSTARILEKSGNRLAMDGSGAPALLEQWIDDGSWNPIAEAPEFASDPVFLPDLDLAVAVVRPEPASYNWTLNLHQGLETAWSTSGPQPGFVARVSTHEIHDIAHGAGWLVVGRDRISDETLEFSQGPSGSLSAIHFPFSEVTFASGRFIGIEPALITKTYPPGTGTATRMNDPGHYRRGPNSIYLSDPVPPYPFAEGPLSRDTWRRSVWFDWVFTRHYPWSYQYEMGWVYVHGPDENNCWIWQESLGWFWTSQHHWPTIWSPDSGWSPHPSAD